jgi:transcriptional regulator with XRE-family HTH domain
MEPQELVLELKRLGMTQSEIASSVGCSQATISEIQNGKQKRPSYRMVRALTELYERRVAEVAPDSNASSDDAQNPSGGVSERGIKEMRMVA